MAPDKQVPTPRDDVSWEAWGNHVLLTLEKLEDKVDKLEDKISGHRENTVVEIATLKAKAGVWGSVAGVIASLVVSVVAGFIVYSLTQGSIDSLKYKNVYKTPTPIGKVLPPREDPLSGYNTNTENTK